jgi:transposase
MVQHAKAHGIKPAARVFHATPKTIRTWMRRFDGTLASLAERSRRPHHSPQKLHPAQEQKIVQLKKRLPRWSARRLKRDFDLPYAEKTIRRVCRDHGLNRKYRRKKHQTKRCLREVKKAWRLFQQIDIDTKDLCDIPEYWEQMQRAGLVRYQYTARDVSTGLLFLGFAAELSLSYADLFAQRIIDHLRRCQIDMSGTTWQSDNGTEFVGSWQAKNDSEFTKTIQTVKGQIHRTIPPGQHRFQADVETVHSLMETEFYEIEAFADRRNFLDKATTYSLYFNLARKNSGKENKTPWELICDKYVLAHKNDPCHPKQPDPRLSILPPVYLDQLWFNRLNITHSGGYDVGALPFHHRDQTIFHNYAAVVKSRRYRY